jgi:hypothetical protein
MGPGPERCGGHDRRRRLLDPRASLLQDHGLLAVGVLQIPRGQLGRLEAGRTVPDVRNFQANTKATRAVIVRRISLMVCRAIALYLEDDPVRVQVRGNPRRGDRRGHGRRKGGGRVAELHAREGRIVLVSVVVLEDGVGPNENLEGVLGDQVWNLSGQESGEDASAQLLLRDLLLPTTLPEARHSNAPKRNSCCRAWYQQATARVQVTPSPTIVDFVTDAESLGLMLSPAQETLLTRSTGLPLTEEQLAIWRLCTGARRTRACRSRR